MPAIGCAQLCDTLRLDYLIQLSFFVVSINDIDAGLMRHGTSAPYGTSSEFGATFGTRRKYLSMSFGFVVPARSRRKSSAARKEPTFSATAMNWFNDTQSVAANSAAAFFTDVGSFNG